MKRVVAIGALVVVAATAGCGGGSGDDAAVSPPVSGTMPTVAIQTPTVTTLPGDAEAGRTTFEQTCQGCHPAGGAEEGTGPQLTEQGFTPEEIRHQVTDPRMAMPPNLVAGADLDNVVAFLAAQQ